MGETEDLHWSSSVPPEGLTCTWRGRSITYVSCNMKMEIFFFLPSLFWDFTKGSPASYTMDPATSTSQTQGQIQWLDLSLSWPAALVFCKQIEGFYFEGLARCQESSSSRLNIFPHFLPFAQWQDWGLVLRAVTTTVFWITLISCRDIFERVVHLSLAPKKMKFLFKRYLDYEKKFGTTESVLAVKRAALEYVETKSSLADI